MVLVGADTIHTSCSRTIDAAENFVIHVVAVRQNFESTAIDSDGAIAIERVVDVYRTIMATTGTAAIKLGDDDTAVDVFIIVVF